jgi:stage V sporulation protein S
MSKPIEPFRVSSQSSPNSTAGAIANVVREQGYAELQVIGAGALNQAIKAIAIARTFLAPDDVDLVCVPTFTEVRINGELRTAIRLAVHDRQATVPHDLASMEAPHEQPATTSEAPDD